ncbi:hypothetical protein [Streptomyces sp. NPDC002346]
MQDEDLPPIRSVEIGRVDVPGQVGHVHAAAVRIKGEAVTITGSFGKVRLPRAHLEPIYKS